METKPLLFGLIGFFLGGLIVSVAATTFDKPIQDGATMSMNQMTSPLVDKRGDDYDKLFLDSMILHHQGAIEMAELSASNAKHDEIKRLSGDVITAQKQEIEQMKLWQKAWGYTSSDSHSSSNH